MVYDKHKWALLHKFFRDLLHESNMKTGSYEWLDPYKIQGHELLVLQ